MARIDSRIFPAGEDAAAAADLSGMRIAGGHNRHALPYLRREFAIFHRRGDEDAGEVDADAIADDVRDAEHLLFVLRN